MHHQKRCNYSSCCRLCLVDNQTLKPIFDDESGGLSLVTKILAFLGVQVNINDKVSTMICNGCLSKIDMWELYKEKCFYNQTKLHKWMKEWDENNSSTYIKNEPMEEEGIYFETNEEVMNQTPDVNDLLEISIYKTPHNGRQCMYCNKVFSTPGNRRKHEKFKHEKRELQSYYADNSRDNGNVKNVELNYKSPSEEKNNKTPFLLQPLEVSHGTVEIQKIEFAGALKLQAANGLKIFQTGNALTNIEHCYIDKCRKMITMFNSLECFCHGVLHKSIKRLFAHLRLICNWFPIYTCYNCMITFVDRSSLMRHNSKCQRRPFENLIKLSMLQSNSAMKVRLYQNYKCFSCSYIFNFYEDYCDHIDNEHIIDEPPYNCICETVFENVDDYQQHLHTSCLLQFYCDICFETFSTSNAFKSHAEQHHDQSDGFEFLTEGDISKPNKIDKNPDISVNSTLINSLDSTSMSVNESETDHEIVECAPDLEISSYEDNDSSLPPPAPPPKNWNARSSCTVCGKTYSNYHNMIRHYKTHTDSEKTIPCEHCNQMFRLKGHLKEHLVIDHGYLDVKPGVKSSLDSTTYLCPECNINFTCVDEWNKHKDTHPLQTCEECGKEFSFKSELEQHRNEHLTLKVYRDSKTHSYKSAQVSPTSLNVKIEPEEVKKVTAPVKKYHCNPCDKHYASYSSLWEHNKKYHPDRRVSNNYPRQCKYCDKVLQTGGAYFKHKQMHERLLSSKKVEKDNARKGDDEDYFTCNRCFKVFTTKSTLKIHMKSHGKNSGRNLSAKSGKFKTYWCNICHQACQGYMELQSHKQEHQVEKMNEFRETNHVTDKPQLSMMKMEVTDGMDYVDDVKPEFNEELEILAIKDNVIFPCDICDLEFSSKTSLKKHKERHDEELPSTQKHTYVYCKYCKIPFISVGKLNEHMELEHDEIPGIPKVKVGATSETHPCNLCKKVFDSSGALCSHQGWHKRIKAGEKSKVLLKQVLKEFPKTTLKFQCKTCAQNFDNDTSLQIHILEVHRNINASIIPPRCNMCDLDFDTQAAYDKHNQLHQIANKQNKQQNQTFKCKYCNKVFARAELLFNHVKQHHKNKLQQGNYACPICNRSFDRPQSLASHVKIHDRQYIQSGPSQTPKIANDFLYTCSICHVGFNIPKELRNHIISAHPF